jgi:hypothetical protein
MSDVRECRSFLFGIWDLEFDFWNLAFLFKHETSYTEEDV